MVWPQPLPSVPRSPRGNHRLLHSVEQAGLKRTEAWESAVPAEESPQPGPANRADSETFYKRISSFLLWEPEGSITQLAVLLNPRPPPECYLVFLLLLVWADCDEGDTVELDHSTILPGLVMGGTGSPGDAPPYVMFPGLLQPFAKGRGKWGGEGLEACWGISGLPGPSSTEFWARGGRKLHNSDKEFSLTIGADAEAWRREPEVGRGTRAGERERGSSPATFPNEFEELYKNSNEEKIYTKHLECDENVIISFSRRFKTSTSDNCALTPLRRQDFLRIVFEKIICLLDRSWNHIHSFMETICLRGKRLFLSTWLRHVVLEFLKRLFFC